MTVYIFVALLLSFFAIIQNENNKNILLFIAILVLFVISGWRAFSVGTDTLNYKMSFDYLSYDLRFIDIRSNEIFYPYLMYFIQSFGGDYRNFIIITSAIFCFLVYVASKQCENSLIAILLFWLLGNFFMFYNISRQEIAVLLSLCAFFCLERKKMILYLLLILLGISIHTSIIFIILFLLLMRIKIERKYLFIVPILFIITFVIPIFFDTRIFMRVFENMGNIESTYNMYFDAMVDSKGFFSFNRMLINVFFAILPFIDRSYGRNKYYNFIIMYIMIHNLFPFSSAITRIGLYFSVVTIPYFTSIICQNKMVSYFVLLYSIVIFLFNLAVNNGGIVPYIWGD